jgi:hypothetical protein
VRRDYLSKEYLKEELFLPDRFLLVHRKWLTLPQERFFARKPQSQNERQGLTSHDIPQ